MEEIKMKKKIGIIILIAVSLLTISCATIKQNFMNFKYEGEDNTWKVDICQYKTNDIDISIEYKGMEKLPEMIEFQYYTDKQGYSSGGVISKTNDLKRYLAKGKVEVTKPNNPQLKLTKLTIKYNNKNDDIKLNCYEKQQLLIFYWENHFSCYTDL